MKTENNILLAFILNASFSIFELIGGIFTNSVAIISDSFHDLLDAISILISYFLEKKSKKEPNDIYTYGYTRYSVLGASITNTILIVGTVFIIYYAIKRLIKPVFLDYDGMLFLAIVGTIVNLLAVYFTHGGKSLNQKAINLHMMEDVFGWIIVLIGSIVMKFTNINMIDAILSLIVACFILISSLKSFKKILDLFLQKVPKEIDLEKVKRQLMKNSSIKDIHHVHFFSMDDVNNYVTMHVVITTDDYDNLKRNIKKELKKIGITHSTIEFEREGFGCSEEKCLIENHDRLHHH